MPPPPSSKPAKPKQKTKRRSMQKKISNNTKERKGRQKDKKKKKTQEMAVDLPNGKGNSQGVAKTDDAMKSNLKSPIGLGPVPSATSVNDETIDVEGSDAAGQDDPSVLLKSKGQNNPLELKTESTKGGQKINVEAWCELMTKKGPEGIAMEFKPSGSKKFLDDEIKAYNENGEFNRYLNTFCIEKTRVKVANGQPNDYIHANYVYNLVGKPKFIAAQGPMDNCIDQFWRMIIGEKISSILMLCDTTEKGISKCAPYYPTDPNQSSRFGSIIVKCRGKSDLGGTAPVYVEVSLLEAKDEATNGPWITIRHFHWVSWEDHGIPAGFLAPIRLLHSQHVRMSQAPVLVHCSAGVGRTGTIILISAAEQLLTKGEGGELMQLLQKLREQRPLLVQNELQYLYVHRVLLEYFTTKGLMAKEKLDKFVKSYEEFVVAQRKRRRRRSKDPRKESMEPSNDRF